MVRGYFRGFTFQEGLLHHQKEEKEEKEETARQYIHP